MPINSTLSHRRRQHSRAVQVHPGKIARIVGNRGAATAEQYLVLWQNSARWSYAPMSWHTVEELSHCLEFLQAYLESPAFLQLTSRMGVSSKHPMQNGHLEGPNRSAEDVETYNTTLRVADGFFEPNLDGDNEFVRDNVSIITDAMKQAQHGSTHAAREAIRKKFEKRLRRISMQARITWRNAVDQTLPPLYFQFIDESELGEGVFRAPRETVIGCRQCRPDMGQNVGCEYAFKCDCLEFAAVDEKKLEQTAEIDPTRVPKRFPYTLPTKNSLLVSFYLDSRNMIYECNENCRCGPGCKNRNVQKRRRVPLEIFRTRNRGWGLRCTQDLARGEFIDTYRGEIITDAEAHRREERGGQAKDSYLYSLDHFTRDDDLKCYVIDGEFKGGPTRFINHSCEPNCRQFCVSFNKYDHAVYEIAFFALDKIPAFTELTFDYVDGEGKSLDRDQGGRTPCKCGAPTCREWLWS